MEKKLNVKMCASHEIVYDLQARSFLLKSECKHAGKQVGIVTVLNHDLEHQVCSHIKQIEAKLKEICR